jgi:hypothetical protein
MTPIDAAAARAEQATRDRELAEAALLAAIEARGIKLGLSAKLPMSEVVHCRAVEARTESNDREFCKVYSACRRCQNAETKARSALHRAKLHDIATICRPSVANAPLSTTAVFEGLAEMGRAA